MTKSFAVQNIARPLYTFLEFFMINEKQSLTFQYLQFFCSEVQYLAILLWMQASLFTFDDPNPASIFIRKFSRTIVFKNVLQEDLPIHVLSACSIALWVYFSLVYLIVGYLALKALKRKTIKQSLLKAFHMLFQMHFGIIFWVANMIFMVTIFSKQKGITIPVFSSIEGIEGLYYLIQLFLIVLNYVLGMISSIFCFDPFFSENLFSAESSLFQFLNFLFKAIIAPILVFAHHDNLPIRLIFITIAIAISTCRLVCLFGKFLFHHFSSTQIAIIFAIQGIWISFTNMLAIIWFYNGWVRTLSLFYLIFLPLPLNVKLGLERLRRLVTKYGIMNPKMITTKRQISGKLFAYRENSENLILSLNDNIPLRPREIYFIGKLVHHSRICQETECLCLILLKDKKNSNTKSMMDMRSALIEYFYSISVSVLSEAIKNMKDNNDLKITLAHLIFTNPVHRLAPTLVNLFSAPDEKLGFLMKVKKHMLLIKAQGKLSKYFEEGYKEKLNMERFVAYHNDSEKFLSQIISVTDQYLNLWDSYRNPNLKMNSLIQKSEKIEERADKVDRLWNSNVEKYEPFYYLMKDQYKLYLSLVRNMPSLSIEIIKKFQWKKKPKNHDPTSAILKEEDLAGAKVLSLYVSMMKDKLGKVVYASKNFKNYFGYNTEEIVGKNVGYLMPRSIAIKHDRLLLEHLDKSKLSETHDYYTSFVYIKTKAGPVLPCSIHVTVFPYIQNELLYIGVAKILKTKADYIITDSQGYIDSFTEMVGNKLNLSHGKKLHIRDICRDIERLDVFFDKDYRKKRFTSYYIDTKGQAASWLEPLTAEKSTKIRAFLGENIVLNFIMYGSTTKTVKYSTKVTKRVVLDHHLYVFELNIEASNQRRKLKTVALEDLRVCTPEESLSDVPAEKPTLRRMLESNEGLETRNLLTGYQNLDSERVILRDHFPISRMKKVEEYSEMTENNSTKKRTSFLITSNRKTKMESVKELVTLSDKELTFDKKVEALYNFNSNTQSKKISNSTSLHEINLDLEKAVYSLPVNRRLKALMFVAGFLIILYNALLLFLYLETDHNLNLIQENLSVIKTSNLRLFQITEINRRVRIISLYSHGFIDDKRYLSYGIKSVVPTMIFFLNSTQQMLMTYNTLARIALEKIEPALQQYLFSSLIPITCLEENEDSPNSASVFDAATILVIKTKQLVKTKASEITNSNPEIIFLMKNTLNEQLLTSEEITNVILGDNEFKLSSLRDSIIYAIMICFITSSLILGLFTIHQVRFVQNRNKFIEIFLKFSDEQIEQGIKYVKTFKTNLVKDPYEFRDINIEDLIVSPNAQRRNGRSVKGFVSRSREANKQLLNYRVWLAQILVLSLIIIFFVPFIYMVIMGKIKKDLIKQEIGTIVEVNSNLYNINLASAAIYEYIQFNATTNVRTRPVGQEFEELLSKLSGSQQFFSKLMGTESVGGTRADEVGNLMIGNLCQVMNISQPICAYGKGILGKGIIGMNSFILLTLRRVKDLFDASDKSFDSQKEVLGFTNLIDMEYIYAVMQLPAYKRLVDILQNNVANHIQESNEMLRAMFIVAISIYIIFGCLGLKLLWKIVEKERIKWKKLCRNIPFNITLSNKALKNYLVRESDHLLDPIKNNI